MENNNLDDIEVDATIIDTSLSKIKEPDEEREIEIDLDELRRALASNCKTLKTKVKVTGKEVDIIDKLFRW